MKLNTIQNQEKFPFALPDLPFAKDALLPHITEETLDYHHGKHHATYVTNLNKLLETDSAMHSKSLEEILLLAAKDESKSGVFNNAAQIWNHTFYWHCMKQNGGGVPSGSLLQAIEKDFGSFELFSSAFKQAAVSQFGSGWAWLVLSKDGKLSIMKTSNADLPMAHGLRALLTIDVWEHAYYIDYRNRRAEYVDLFMKYLVNWDFVEHCFSM